MTPITRNIMLSGSWEPAYKKTCHAGDCVYDITNLPEGYAGYTRDKQTFHIIGANESGFTSYDLAGLIAFVEGEAPMQITSNDNEDNGTNTTNVSYIPGKAGMIAAGIGLIAVLAYFGLR